jgi:hypothetical protein
MSNINNIPVCKVTIFGVHFKNTSLTNLSGEESCKGSSASRLDDESVTIGDVHSGLQLVLCHQDDALKKNQFDNQKLYQKTITACVKIVNFIYYYFQQTLFCLPWFLNLHAIAHRCVPYSKFFTPFSFKMLALVHFLT